MVRPVTRDELGNVIQQPDEFGDPDVFDLFESLCNSVFGERYARGGFAQIGGYKPPLIVENFIEHARKIVPRGTVFRLNSTTRWVTVDIPQSGSHTYSYEAIETDIVVWLDHLKSMTKRHHDANAQASPANTVSQAGRSASAPVVPAPGARRMLLGRVKGP